MWGPHPGRQRRRAERSAAVLFVRSLWQPTERAVNRAGGTGTLFRRKLAALAPFCVALWGPRARPHQHGEVVQGGKPWPGCRRRRGRRPSLRFCLLAIDSPLEFLDGQNLAFPFKSSGRLKNLLTFYPPALFELRPLVALCDHSSPLQSVERRDRPLRFLYLDPEFSVRLNINDAVLLHPVQRVVCVDQTH